jgi:hypothetical protein
MLPQVFSPWGPLWPMASPAWAVSQCDGGHGSEAECERFLHPCVAEPLYLFGAHPQGIPESFSLSWTECGRTGACQAVHFSSMSMVGNGWIGGRMRANQRVPFICRESKKGVLPGSGKFGAPDMEIQRPAIGPAALSRPGPLEFLTHYSLLAECYAGAPHAPVFP